MPHFQFRYKDSEGQTHSGTAESADRDTLLNELRDKGVILEITS